MYTAIMAARPGEAFLDEAITSIYDQSLPPESAIVVLNGDPRRTSEERVRIAASFPKATILESPIPRVAHALHLALHEVQTRYVSFLDADDLWLPYKQAHQIALLEARRDLDAVCGLTLNYGSRTSTTAVKSAPMAGRLFGAVTFTGSTFSRVGMPDPAAEHFEWMYRWWAMAEKSGIRLAHHGDVVLRRRIHDSNSWVRDHAIGRRQLLRELRRIHASRELA